LCSSVNALLFPTAKQGIVHVAGTTFVMSCDRKSCQKYDGVAAEAISKRAYLNQFEEFLDSNLLPCSERTL